MLSSLTQETATMMEKKYSFDEGVEKEQQTALNILKQFRIGKISIVDAAKALNMSQEEFCALVK